ncbi:MAG: ROK family protein [Patescibacteria group bacterium]
MKTSHIVFDIGGTKTRVAFSNDLTTLVEVASFYTPVEPKAGIKKMIETIGEFADVGTIATISGGIRGVLDEEGRGIVHDDVLSSWVDFDVVGELAKTYSVPMYLENDAALAGLGEAHYGAGVGVDLVVYHTVSTGVGGVRISNGHIDAASAGFEPGHQVLDIDRTILGEDIVPTLENLVSGTAVEKRLGVKPYDIPQSDVIWDELAGYLAQGLRNTILYWSPEAIILGGSMIIGDPKIQLEAIRKATVQVLDSFVECPFITTASLGDEAGLYGALALIRQHS